MRISDWSSDVCSSDLGVVDLHHRTGGARPHHQAVETDLAGGLPERSAPEAEALAECPAVHGGSAFAAAAIGALGPGIGALEVVQSSLAAGEHRDHLGDGFALLLGGEPRWHVWDRKVAR